jgi:hypothetical protein
MFLVYAKIMLKMELTIFSIISISEYEGYDLYYSGSSQGSYSMSVFYTPEPCIRNYHIPKYFYQISDFF